ncbi:MAG: PKD domain-containing protein [Haloarculaceae archaeon]
MRRDAVPAVAVLVVVLLTLVTGAAGSATSTRTARIGRATAVDNPGQTASAVESQDSGVTADASMSAGKRPAPLIEQWSETYDNERGDVISDFEKAKGSVVFVGQTRLAWDESPTTEAWLGSVDTLTGDLRWQHQWGDGKQSVCPSSGNCYDTHPNDEATAITADGTGSFLVSGYSETLGVRYVKKTGKRDCRYNVLLGHVDAGGGFDAKGAGDCTGWTGGASGVAPGSTGSVVAGQHLAEYRAGKTKPEWTAFQNSGIGFTDVIAVPDGYVAVGSESNGPGHLVKVGPGGSVKWSRTIGAGRVRLERVIETENGGYAFTGWSQQHGDLEAFVGEATSSGDVNWTITYGGKGYQSGYDLVEVSGGYVVAGTNAETLPASSKLPGGAIRPPYGDGWLFKVSTGGRPRWEHNFSRTDQVGGFAAIEKTDNGFVMGGGVKDSQGFDRGTLESRDGWVARALRCVDTDGDGTSDDDGDGLCDNWEDDGIDVDGDGQTDLDLHGMGADREHKDVFVEIDYMDCAAEGGESCVVPHDHRPASESLDRIEAAFADAPVDNPDGDPGVDVHLQVDEAVPENRMLDFSASNGYDLGEFKQIKYGDDRCGTGPHDGHFGTEAERRSDDCKKILQARLLAYHYLLSAHNNSIGALGLAPTPGNDVMAFATGPKADDAVRDRARFSHMKDSLSETTVHQERVWLEAVTMMHELGHNLGLRHGGATDRNNKPNYLSIMNYQYAHNYVGRATSLPGVEDDTWTRVDADLDYSRERLPTIDENALDEGVGLRGPGDERSIYIRNASHAAFPARYVVPASGSVDWNRNGRIAGSVSLDANNDGRTTALSGHDDWPSLQYNFRRTEWFRNQYAKLSDFRAGWTIGAHLDAGLGSPDADDDGVTNSADNCPLLANTDQADGNGDGQGDACTRDTEPPVPRFGVERAGGDATLRFDAGNSTDPEDRGVIAFTWQFGDGSVGHGLAPTHTFPEGGRYNVTLTVEDFDGDTATRHRMVSVRAGEGNDNGDSNGGGSDSGTTGGSNGDVTADQSTGDRTGDAAVGPLSTLPGGFAGLALGYGSGLVGGTVLVVLLAVLGVLRSKRP